MEKIKKHRNSEWNLEFRNQLLDLQGRVGEKPIKSAEVVEIITAVDAKWGIVNKFSPSEKLQSLKEQGLINYEAIGKNRWRCYRFLPVVFKTETEKEMETLPQPKVVGKIDLDSINSAIRPKAKSKEEKRQERKDRKAKKLISFRRIISCYRFFTAFKSCPRQTAQQLQIKFKRSITSGEVNKHRHTAERIWGREMILIQEKNSDHRRIDVEVIDEEVHDVLHAIVGYVERYYPERVQKVIKKPQLQFKEEEVSEPKVEEFISEPEANTETSTEPEVVAEEVKIEKAEFGKLGYTLAVILKNHGKASVEILQDLIYTSMTLNLHPSTREIKDLMESYPEIFEIKEDDVTLKDWNAAFELYNPKKNKRTLVWYIKSGLSLETVREFFRNAQNIEGKRELIKFEVDETTKDLLCLAQLVNCYMGPKDVCIDADIDLKTLKKFYVDAILYKEEEA